ncbi:IPP transferase-domain-containing protein [Aspergillus pseudonomiae]|uniref:tRNA dimethylallyltransferase n=1 Tax=Aspergillus pseudonomiae TaxID=1506151 RepID=A0A5N7CYX8_9EURO|nr:IPP transferase-domain-containing protein [Aspergillus pseudonomiae]KAE8399395.1 IPP transferase-domain-containing protein [Aspergillus pseudonomiae]
MRPFLRYPFFARRPPNMEPLIAIVGATGTGKSKLAVDLATRFNGEIINGDAMQMYRGLPIITNQIPMDERNNIPHHLINCIELDEEPWRIGLFKSECLRIIKDIHSRGKLPILVGGTHYYTQAVLFKDQLVGEGSDEIQGSGARSDGEAEESSTKWPILDAPTDVVLQKLREVDPVMADRWHPNDTRKIRRSLEIYFQTGRPASEVYADQKRLKQAALANGDPSAGEGQLRFPMMVFWIHSEREALIARLDKRVDVMIEQGLMSEAQRMSDYIRERRTQGCSIDPTRGVWVAIGFKELAPYFEALHKRSLSGDELESLKESCIESIKIATRQYSASQVKWIRNKLWNTLAETGMAHRLYLLDSTNVENWGSCITEPSELLTQALLKDESAPDPKSLSELAKTILGAKESQSQKGPGFAAKCFTCDVCRKTMVNEEQWNIHLNGHSHKRVLKAMAKRAEREKSLQAREDNTGRISRDTGSESLEEQNFLSDLFQ